MYGFELIQLAAVAVLLALAIYLPAATGALVLCFGTIMSCGAITAGLVGHIWHLPVAVALMIGGLAGGVSGCLIGCILARLRGLAFALATLAISECVRIAVTNTDRLGGALGFRGDNAAVGSFWPLLAACGAIIIFLEVDRSGFRRALATIRQSEPLARSLGISPAGHRIAAMGLGGIFAGVAGVLYLNVVGILEPKTIGFESGLLIAAYAIIGGTRRFWGPAVAAVVLSLVPELFRFSSSARLLLYGACVTIVTVLWPDGFVSYTNFGRLFADRKRRGAAAR